MKKVLSILIMTSVLLFAIFSIAADRVVVIPLGGKKCTNPSENSITNSTGMTFNPIPSGIFTMGSPLDEPLRGTDEIKHEVTLTKAFYLQTTEVTNRQWNKVIVDNVLGVNPSQSHTGDDYPVEFVNWYEAAYFANILSVLESRSNCYTLSGCGGNAGEGRTCTGVSINYGCTGYRLPTEAEWEYAARATTTTAWAYLYTYDTSATGQVVNFNFNSNLVAVGWYVWNNTSDYTIGTKPVAKKQPNKWGLYDMHGNVYEWCQDWYKLDYYSDPGSDINPQGPATGLTRVFRGGAFNEFAANARSAYRSDYEQADRVSNIGFRLVLPQGQ